MIPPLLGYSNDAFRGSPHFILTLDGYVMSYNALRLMMNRLAKGSGVERLHPIF